MCHFEKRKTVTIPKIIDFFLRIEGKLIAVNVAISALITLIVVHTFPAKWQDSLKATSLAVSILGAFLSFALVFRTQTCYNRWWEARTQWGRMTSACVNIAGQARNWFADEDLVDKFLTHCIVFPYACKSVLRGNQLNDAMEEGPRFLHSGMLTDADLGIIIRHGRPPFTCLEIMRRIMFEALCQDERDFPPEMLNGILISMEQSIWELNLNFGACLKIGNTRMPASYTLFMRSFVIFFFAMANLSWAPTLKWLTPIITGFMVFVINTVIVIGDQMMHPFDLQWAGLALQKFCVIIEHEVMNVSQRHADIECLF
jgi:putative membrane protein